MAKECIIKNVSEFIRRVSEIKGKQKQSGNKADLIFRGQKSKDSLKPNIMNYESHKDIKKMEKLVLTEFQRLSLPFISNSRSKAPEPIAN